MKRTILALALAGASFAASALPPPGGGPPGPLDVNVTNPVLQVEVSNADPVPVKNANEPGKEPYEYYIEFTKSSCSFNCSNFNNFGVVYLFDGPAVPDGKRLVIQQVTGRLPNTGIADVSVALQGTQIISQQEIKWAFYGPFFMQSELPGFTSGAFATYGPGERPHFNLVLPAVNNYVAYVTVSGYLIDAN